MRISDWSSDVCSSDLLASSLGFAKQWTGSFAPGFTIFAGLTAVALVALRSEEHTSELQSLMRISYAVFCLKKKNKHTKKNINKRTHIYTINSINIINITTNNKTMTTND